ncbi:GMC family oxidoreductase [Kutzneria sp. CA-103260]|uniref:GMC family oxidoreductase n=1 Tax=Kutzneria sp. CA-103260 TaxID=2802641 RepID=UPI001BA79476|nr:GMC oxidoreductase [Kutzneria sp. CA-103260]
MVGAGSSGAVLAARLACLTDRSVLLVEAGPDYHARSLPPELRNGRTPALGSHDWGYTLRGPGDRNLWLPRGKIVGGCSAINTCIALRPEPGDFDDWPSGAQTWSWDHVLDAFTAIETDADHVEYHHGRSGALPVARTPVEQMTSLSRSFLSACVRAGHDRVDDHNEPGTSGVGALPLNLGASLERVSAATAFLEPARLRPNLTIMAQATVDSLLFAGDRVVGVQIIAEGRAHRIGADEVTVAAGAVGTPAVLLRSGIGPAADLRALGIDVVADLPAVGANLADHSQVPLLCAPASGAVDTSAPCAEAVLRYTSDGWGPTNDMQLCLLNHVEMSAYAPHLAHLCESSHAFVITANLMRPDSRGTVRLTSRDPVRPPEIRLDYLAAASDRIRLREGLRLAHRIAADEEMRGHVQRVLGADELTFADDASVDRYVAHQVQTAHHPTGTAAMSADPGSGVVDSACRVFGTEGLRVADASIIPSSVRANTNLTCMMIGERVARLLAGTARMESVVERV